MWRCAGALAGSRAPGPRRRDPAAVVRGFDFPWWRHRARWHLHQRPAPACARQPAATQTVQATALEYWSVAGQTTIAADTVSQVDLDLQRVCYATVVGTVLNALTGQSLAGADVFTRDWFTGAFVGVKTDAAGAYRLDGIRVGNNNTPIVQQISASADDFQIDSIALK